MIDYLYDGTFEGLLTCIYHHYYTEKAAGIFEKEEYQSTVLGGYMDVETEADKAMRVYDAIKCKISDDDLKRVYKVFMSSVESKETKILNYVRLGFTQGPKTNRLHGNPIVFEAQTAEKKVNGEIHRMFGLIRFSEMQNGIMYSDIEPDHDILEFLAGHFADRFKGEPFIIHDVKREKALAAYERKWYITKFTAGDVPETCENEKAYRRLWKHYFENIAIKERTNPRCQKNFMPVRYWKHLTEKNIYDTI